MKSVIYAWRHRESRVLHVCSICTFPHCSISLHMAKNDSDVFTLIINQVNNTANFPSRTKENRVQLGLAEGNNSVWMKYNSFRLFSILLTCALSRKQFILTYSAKTHLKTLNVILRLGTRGSSEWHNMSENNFIETCCRHCISIYKIELHFSLKQKQIIQLNRMILYIQRLNMTCVQIK